ncbi:hypothetical protein HC891_10990 [Candidatus Gracilibacteria bacterium]|nr:hypothetical protein [Candidatus Gracilibacteria bacterium]
MAGRDRRAARLFSGLAWWVVASQRGRIRTFCRYDGGSFAIITPGGELVERVSLLHNLRSAHASRPGMRIWIVNPQLRMRQGMLTLATYEEWQEVNSVTTARVSSVLFADQHDTPNGVRWLHVHETWMPR